MCGGALPAIYGCSRAGEAFRARDVGSGIRGGAGGRRGLKGNVSLPAVLLPWKSLNTLAVVWMRINQSLMSKHSNSS